MPIPSTADRVTFARNSRDKHRVIADRLRQRMRGRDVRAGDRLSSFAELEAEFSVTPTTINRALMALEQEGLISRQRGRGIFVRSQEPREDRALTVACGGIALRHPFHYWTAVIAGLYAGAERAGRRVTFVQLDAELDPRSVDGLVQFSEYPGVDRRIADLPTVHIMHSIPGVPSVVADDMEAGEIAANHLLDLGHRRIALLMQQDARMPLLRKTGYQLALQRRGILFDDELARPILTTADAPKSMPEWMAYGYMYMSRWLADGWRDLGATALIVQNDESAIGALRALAEAGYRVPDDVSVVGFDGLEIGAFASPALTTVEMPYFECAAVAIERLYRMIGGQPVSPYPLSLPSKLIARESTTHIDI